MSIDRLLDRVHERIGGVGLDIQTDGSGLVEIRWRRDYGEDGLSDERVVATNSLERSFARVIEVEDVVDAREQS